MIKKVLVIDDDEIFHYLSIRILNSLKLDLNIKAFLNGKLGLDYLINEYSNEDRFYVFLDINMPVMNGWEFLENLKKSIINLENILIYIVSSSTDEEDVAYSKKFTFVKGYISKPLGKEHLIEIF